ncbi:DUF4158 domain-containing protein [Candidatus Odyssella acanthamoebae]|uniref:DUF4158 domain-containing protein n=1 Tax=Candidatus Odyssella acanthamoebae TaxID=91604 RepID=A0A077AW61_9PROT|nr:DUF4158 domain-containing protein [Candidatus Paracaedibacter acanthamoebae]AIK96289.1 hypothetical protein ID47_05370 [Candidatus Paracaedibacter acanthamoebae]
MESRYAITRQLLNEVGPLSKEEQEWVFQCRRDPNRLGFCYQLIFVKVFNRFPQQEPFEIIPEILNFVSSQINIKSSTGLAVMLVLYSTTH